MRCVLARLIVAAALLASVTAHAEDGSFHSAGVELRYGSSGSGIPVVLLSGGPGLTVDYVRPLAGFLPSGHRAIAFEQRGTGGSRPQPFDPATLTLGGAVGDLEALRLHLRQDRLTLLGHSWGGMLAMAYAVVHPERIDRLILIGSGGPTLEFQQWFGDNIEARLRPEDMDLRRRWMAAARNGEDAAKASIESLKAIVPGYFFDRAAGLAFAAELKVGHLQPDVSGQLFADLKKHYDVREGLKKLQRPVLIIQGHQDPIGDKTAEDIHALIGSSQLVYINRCGHFPWIEQPDALRQAISKFLSTPGH